MLLTLTICTGFALLPGGQILFAHSMFNFYRCSRALLSLVPRRGIVCPLAGRAFTLFVLIQKSKQKKSRQNEASARGATSRSPFCRACARIDIIGFFLWVLCLLVSMRKKQLALVWIAVVICAKKHPKQLTKSPEGATYQ
jgi:hypothetical protein